MKGGGRYVLVPRYGHTAGNQLVEMAKGSPTVSFVVYPPNAPSCGVMMNYIVVWEENNPNHYVTEIKKTGQTIKSNTELPDDFVEIIG